MDEVLEKIVLCLHQAFRLKVIPGMIYFPGREGCGVCETCEYDPVNNLKCKGYVPVTNYIVHVGEVVSDVKD